jgi:hypothetical protein
MVHVFVDGDEKWIRFKSSNVFEGGNDIACFSGKEYPIEMDHGKVPPARYVVIDKKIHYLSGDE